MSTYKESTEYRALKLKAVRLLLNVADRFKSNPSLWTQGELARDKHGAAVSPDKPYACSFCSLGMMHNLERDPEVRWAAYDGLEMVGIKNLGQLMSYNDAVGREVADVIEKFHTAGIKLEETLT